MHAKRVLPYENECEGRIRRSILNDYVLVSTLNRNQKTSYDMQINRKYHFFSKTAKLPPRIPLRASR